MEITGVEDNDIWGWYAPVIRTFLPVAERARRVGEMAGYASL